VTAWLTSLVMTCGVGVGAECEGVGGSEGVCEGKCARRRSWPGGGGAAEESKERKVG
jgi:hypothetical protein